MSEIFLSNSLEKESLLRTFRKAVLRRSIKSGLIFHSDRGIQYASLEFRSELKRHGCIQSMSRKGDCWDNAVVESFFHTLKSQLLYNRRFINKSEAEQDRSRFRSGFS